MRRIEPVRGKTNKLDQNIDFCVLVFYDRMGNTLQIGALSFLFLLSVPGILAFRGGVGRGNLRNDVTL